MVGEEVDKLVADGWGVEVGFRVGNISSCAFVVWRSPLAASVAARNFIVSCLLLYECT